MKKTRKRNNFDILEKKHLGETHVKKKVVNLGAVFKLQRPFSPADREDGWMDGREEGRGGERRGMRGDEQHEGKERGRKRRRKYDKKEGEISGWD